MSKRIAFGLISTSHSPRPMLFLPLLLAWFLLAAGSSLAHAHQIKVSGNVPNGQTGQSYQGSITVSGGSPPYQYDLKVVGSLPPGLTLTESGTIVGTPTTAGNYSFEILVTDVPHGDSGTQTFQVSISAQNVTVTISPTSAQVPSTQTEQFSAAITGTSNTAVTWSANAGTISSKGLFTAPNVSNPTNVVVTATSVAVPTQSASASVTVTPQNASALTITNGNPPDAAQNASYSFPFNATGGTQPYSWTVTAGTLPSGLGLSTSGNVSGTPTSIGTSSFTVTVADSAKNSATASYSLNVDASSGYDGPAELPQAQVPSAMADTPAPGNVIQVAAGANLQTAINNASCGDTIELQAGAAFSGKNITLPAKSCDNQHWIIIRTSAPDSSLPAEGQRLTPCYAGVSSLPNRPAYPCSNPQDVLATISNSVDGGSGPLLLANGANHYRLLGLEITRPADKSSVVDLISEAPTGGVYGTASYIVVDRCWLHGTPQDETRRGVAMAGTTNFAVVDSYLNDFHCTALTGMCTDSSAVGGGSGNNTSGPWKIVGNFLEAAGENILFGGAAATIVPADITIQFNHFYKVPQWQQGMPGFVGGYDGNPFVVKNHFEIKNASRVLLEGNIMEYSWGGFTQYGHSIMITPRNDYNKKTKQGNLCPVCEATDVTIRYNRMSHLGSGIAIANELTDGMGAQAGERFSIHDDVIDDIEADKYIGGGGLFMLINAWPKQTLNNIYIRHVTGFPDPGGHLLSISNNLSDPEMYAFTFEDNIDVVPTYPVWSAGEKNDCSLADKPLAVLNSCFASWTFTNNVLAAPTKAFPPTLWPINNMFPAAVQDIQFVNYNGANGGDYHLEASSPYKGTASDGTDPGANIDSLNAAIQNVE